MSNYIKTKDGITKDGSKGGIFKGARHSSPEGGIPVVVDGESNILVEDAEPVIIPEAVNSPKKHLFNGKEMTAKQILSEINTKYNGVTIKKKGGILEKGGEVEFKAKTDRTYFEYVPIKEIEPYIEFDREKEIKFDKKELDSLTKEISKNGITFPITLEIYNNKGLITEGNHRIAAAKRLGIKYIPITIIERNKDFGSINKHKAKKLPYNVGYDYAKKMYDVKLLDSDKSAAVYGFTRIMPKQHGGLLSIEPIPVKSGSVIITRNAALDTTTKNTFDGKKMTNIEVLSEINKSGGGVEFKEGGKVDEEINESNFFKATKAEFKPVSINKKYFEITDKWEEIKEKGDWHRSPTSRSEYVTTNIGVYRLSNHWDIFFTSSCYWQMKGAKKELWSIGYCDFKDFKKMDENDISEIVKERKSKYQNGGTIDKAISVLKTTDVPYIFKDAKDNNPEELIKYIAEQGQKLHSEDKEDLYKATCKIFGKELTDASIEAYPIRFSEGGILFNTDDTTLENLKINGIVIKDNDSNICVISYNSGGQIRDFKLYNINLIYDSVKKININSANEIIDNFNDRNVTKFSDKVLNENCNHLIICNQNEVIYSKKDYGIGGVIREEKISVSTLHNKNKNIPTSFINSQLAIGIQTEMEHTDNVEIAKEIALVHLNENVFYYEYLSKMEDELNQLDIDKHYEEIKDSYGEGGKVNDIFTFRTPTNQKSRLTYIQQVLIRTSAFKNWFGDWETAAKRFLNDGKNNFNKHYKDVSKVLDYVTLEPKVVYHGTRVEKEFDEFDVTKKEGIGRPYAYFAVNKEYADNFTITSQRGVVKNGSTPILFNCFLNIRNPFYANTDKYVDEMGGYKYWLIQISQTIFDSKYKNENEDFKNAVNNSISSQILNYLKETYSNKDGMFWYLMARDSEKYFKYFLLSYDFDGVFYSEEFTSIYNVENPKEFTYAYTVFDASQIKVADGRNTKFSPFTNNIKLAEGGIISDVHNNVNQQIEDMNKIEKIESILEKGGCIYKNVNVSKIDKNNSQLKHTFAEHNKTQSTKTDSNKYINNIYGGK
jgi:hypothetical protein